MKPTAKFFKHDGKIWFDIVDMDDTTTVGDDVLPELLFTSKKGYIREGSADRAADKAIEEFSRASESDRRRMCGYDEESECRTGKDRTTRRKLRKRPQRA